MVKYYQRGEEMARLTGEFYGRDTLTVARELVGCLLVRETAAGRLLCRVTETEAYVGAVDKACHAYGGRRTARTETLYAAPGTTYVYFIYGMHHCLNLVTEPEGVAAAVLIRGAEPLEGLDEIARRRFGTDYGSLTPARRRSLLNGPGKLCRGLGVTRADNGLPISNGGLYLCDSLPGYPDLRDTLTVSSGPRIGIDYAQEAADFPWRFYIAAPPATPGRK